MTAAITAETFASHVGKAASLSSGHQLNLVAVELPKSTPSAAPGRTGFTLVLRGAPSPIAAEGMYAITFEDGASFDLYIIPVHTPSRDHQDYQVVFN